MDNTLFQEAQVAAKYIQSKFKLNLPQIAVILGSGLGSFINMVKPIESIKYIDIPAFPHAHVAGHKGNLTIAEIALGKYALIMEGRFHFYEGYTPQQVTFPILVFHLLGIKTLIVSNAAGGINPAFQVGDLMLINDHINFTGNHPLIGNNNAQLGPRFLDQTQPYDLNLIAQAKLVASKIGIKPQEGIYIGVSGPTYETKAEIKAFATLGADAVGMSTLYEVIMANYYGIKVLGISSITNMATGLSSYKQEHAEVVSVAHAISAKFSNWVKEIIKVIIS